MQVQILSTSNTTKPTARGGTYNELEVAYKNLTFQGKVESKKLMSFGANEGAYKALVIAQQGEVYEVDVKKNDKGYNDWVKVDKSVGSAEAQASSLGRVSTASHTVSPTSVPARSTYETPEERAKKQVYIVRQSSISNAIDALTPGAEGALDPKKVVEVAKIFEDYVFAKEAAPSMDINDIEEDIPF